MSFFRKILGISKEDRDDAKFLASVKKGVQEMKDQLDALTRAASDAMSHHNRIESEYQKFMRQAADWKDRAKEALGANNEELARTALSRKAECERTAESMKGSVEESRQNNQQFTQQIQQLKQKIAEAERNASTLVARKQAAKAQKRLADSMAGIGSKDCAFNAINDYENQVITQESKASVLEKLGVIESAEVVTESDSEIEDELAALKREMK